MPFIAAVTRNMFINIISVIVGDVLTDFINVFAVLFIKFLQIIKENTVYVSMEVMATITVF